MEPTDETDPILELLEGAITAIEEGTPDYVIDISSLNLNVNIKGGNWGGIVDKPVAKFILEFDRAIRNQLRELGYDLPKSKHGVVAFEVKEGSMDAWLQLSKEFVELFKAVPLESQIALLTAILTGLGLVKLPSIVRAFMEARLEEVKGQNSVAAEKARGESTEKLLSQVEAVVAASRELQAPLRSNLVGTMTENDVIQLPSTEEPLTKSQAKRELSKGTRSKVENYYIDHVYIVSSINMKKSPWEVGLEYGDVSFSAKLILSQKDADKLWSGFQEAHKKDRKIAPDLQVTARINGKQEIKSAEIVGIGKPRSDSRKLSDLLGR